MSGSPSLRELIDIDELQSIQDGFARAVGISSVILSPEGEPLTKFTDPTGFCSLIQSTEKGRERCFQSFMEMGEIALGAQEPEICYCFAHGGHFVAPIIVDGEHKGTVFTGQFIPEKFSPEQLEELEKIALEIDLGPGLLVKEAEKMCVVGEDVVRNYSSLLFKIVEIITKRGAQAAELIRAKDALEKAHDELELRFRDIAGAMSDWVWEVDADARYTYCSEKVKDVLGYSADEMIGKTPFDFMLPDKDESVGAVFAELVRERRPIRSMENWIRTKDGRSVCLLTSGVPILNDAGELLGYRGVDSDITERKLTENALRESEVKYRNIIENIQEVFYRADIEGNLVMTSPSGAKLLGYDSVEEMIGLNIAKTFYAVPEEHDEFLKVLEKKGVANDYEVTLKKTDGTLVPVRANSHRYFDKSGNPLGVEGLLSDITERKRAEQEIENLQRYNRGLIEVSIDLLVTFDHEGIILDMNRAMIQATGRTWEELIGTPFADYFTDPERAYKGAMLAFEIGGVRDYELVMKAMDGTETIVSYNTSIYRDQTGDVVGAFATARDITERKAAEEEIKKKTEESEGFNKLAVGRELKMIELKKEINALLWKLGEKPEYEIAGES